MTTKQAPDIVEGDEEMTGDDLAAFEAPEWPQVDIERIRPFVIQRDGKDFILYAGLLGILHQTSEGYFDVTTKLEQAPTDANGQTAIVAAKVTINDPADPFKPKRSSSGIGDANASNVTRLMAPHVIRMAETRAIARAIRVLCDVGMTAFEELGGADQVKAQPARSDQRKSYGAEAHDAPPQIERIQVDGKTYTRPQVWMAYEQRLRAARGAGLVVPDDLIKGPNDPLSEIAGAAQGIRRLMA